MLGSLLAILGFILLSAFFSGTEIAYSSANELRLRRAASEGDARAKWTYTLLDRYDDTLITILLGNNLVNTAASSLATVVVIDLLGDGYAWVATFVLTLLLLVFGEIVPKVVAKENPEQFATAVAPVVRGLAWITRPIVLLVQAFIRWVGRLFKRPRREDTGMTEGELEVILDTAEGEGAIDENTSELFLSAFAFDDMQAYEIVTPRVDMVAVNLHDPMEAILDAALHSPYSRLPVFEESKDNIVGVLHLNRFLKRAVAGQATEADVRAAMMPVCYVACTATLPAVLTTMRQRKCHLVIVVDEFGGTEGLLTMEDVLEELVGDIWDETDEFDPDLIALEGGRYEASGDMRVHALLEALDLEDAHEETRESTTLGGWAAEMLDAYPKEGDTFEAEGLRVTVESVQKRRVVKVLVEPVHTIDTPQPVG